MIVEQYVHTLIPHDPQFCPRREQVSRFVDGLARLGAAPLDADVKVLKPSGRVRSFTNPFTGETKTIPAKDTVPLDSTADLGRIIGTLDEYIVALEGHGPPTLLPSPYTSMTPRWRTTTPLASVAALRVNLYRCPT